MSYSTEDKRFVQKRERLIKYWPVVGFNLMTLIAALGAGLWFKVPYLVNPWAVIDSVKAGALPESTTGVMVVMLPLIMLTLIALMFVFVLLLFVAFNNERRLIRIVRELETGVGY